MDARPAIRRYEGGRTPINDQETAAARLWVTLTLGGSGARSGSARPPPRRLPPTWRTGECKGTTQEVGIGKQQSLDTMLGLGTWASAHFAMGLAANAEHHVQHSSAEPDPNAHGVCCLEGLPIDRLG